MWHDHIFSQRNKATKTALEEGGGEEEGVRVWLGKK